MQYNLGPPQAIEEPFGHKDGVSRDHPDRCLLPLKVRHRRFRRLFIELSHLSQPVSGRGGMFQALHKIAPEP
jgi:hypothetical protein